MTPDEQDDAITKRWQEFVDAGGQCFDWTPNEQRCPRHKVTEQAK